VVFGMTLRLGESLVGTIGLRDIDVEHSQAELGFWVAVECWGQGYATEASRAVVGFGFGQLGLNRIYAHHMVRNPASGRVLTKVGMKQEGLLRQRVRKWGVFENVVPLATLREEWNPD
jgi:[ribosomal protein S5]-alanine N-acetyltransferase